MKIILLAGGMGTRLWPLSTPDRPKQFCSLGMERTLIQQTFDRVSFRDPDDVYIATLSRYFDITKQQLPEIPETNIWGSDFSQDSAFGIIRSLIELRERGVSPDEPLLFLPSDHLIEGDFEHLTETVEQAVLENPTKLFTIGILPQEPNSSLGHILTKSESGISLEVDQFVEKPTLEKIKTFKTYYWNAGFVAGTLGTLLSKAQEYAPAVYQAAESNTNTCENISFDYAVWEKCQPGEIHCVPTRSDINWKDIGSFQTLPSFGEFTDHNNDNTKTFLSSGKKVIIAGMSDCFVVESEDGLLIINQDSMSEIKTILKK